MQTFATWVPLPETDAACRAALRVARLLTASGRAPAGSNPLFLHGPTGSGKSHLVNALVRRCQRRRPDLTAAVLDADVLAAPEGPAAGGGADLLALEDVQRLPARSAAAVAAVLDAALSRRRQVVVTATAGPAQLTSLPARLTSRFAAGLVVNLEPLGADSRRAFLRRRALRRGLDPQEPATAAALDWLADALGGSARQLDGGLTRLAALVRLLGRVPGGDELAGAFRTEAGDSRLTVDAIVRHVGRYFRIDPHRLRAPGKTPVVVLPRQVGMYLARQLTPLSLREIAAYFGGRDHTTVLHACRKVEQALDGAAEPGPLSLAGAVRHLRAELA